MLPEAMRCFFPPRAALVAALLAAPGCQEPTGPVREISGERLYNQYCARCHGMDGKGLPEIEGVGDLTDPARMRTLSDDALRDAIRMGRPPKMPGFGRQFAEPSLDVLAAFVRRLSQPEPDEAKAPGS
ncbi:MAG: cytochrome c [Nannocystaceae bacterium]